MPAKTTSKATATPRPKKPTQSRLNFGPASAKKSDKAITPSKGPANGNILNFFKKVEVEEQLFCGVISGPPLADNATSTVASKHQEEDVYGATDIANDTLSRYNENAGVSKRRKLSHDDSAATVLNIESNHSPVASEVVTTLIAPDTVPTKPKRKFPRGRGPFLDDSDTDEDDTPAPASRVESSGPSQGAQTSNGLPQDGAAPTDELQPIEIVPGFQEALELKKEDSEYDHFREIDDMDAFFDDDEYEDGDEYRERRFMEEQARLEAEETQICLPSELADGPLQGDSMTESCPLCNASLVGITSDQATQHVNACLDGEPIPLPARQDSSPSSPMVDAPEVGKRFSKAAVPRPGQANPISLGVSTSKSTSAFSKIMSGNAEDAAWASAAAAENASRGKPAYKRTCPFYKIMPGFFICVDAFRYGAVQGCNAYFLSHFHSDHYIGLTASWSHGPIYCSEVTASLIRNQLKTDAQWIKPLSFDEKVEVPGTEGVFVTMLPANHCPGSSLFLFEKILGKGLNPRTQRILHCGDFRACPAQVTHQLLKPEIIDSVSGKVKQQKIDICYLDTTYLNPRYSFPPQEDVITACADFCRALSGDPGAADQAFDALKREKGSTTVSQFFQKDEDEGAPQNTKAGKDIISKTDPKNRLLVICGTYSIGKERICKAIAKALNTKIFATPAKIRICQQLGDPELSALMTSNPVEAQVHMQMLMEIRAETLQDYLDSYKPHFTRIVGFRPSGWNFRSGGGGTSGAKNVTANASPSTVPTTQILHGPAWRTRFSSHDFVAQRGSTREAMCFGVPYSEHSSFRELALFVMTLRIEKVVPTVNVGSEPSRKRMKGWTDRWIMERRKGGLVKLLEGRENTDLKPEKADGKKSSSTALWDGKDGKGGGVWW